MRNKHTASVPAPLIHGLQLLSTQFKSYSKGMCLLVLVALGYMPMSAQVSCDPVFPTIDDNVTIYYNALEGNGALNNITPVYIHTGVITDKSTSPGDWKYVATTWAQANPASTMEFVSANLWKKTINIRTFFNIPAGETVLKLAFVFRNGSGSIVGRASGGSDIFYDVYPANAPLQTRILQPTAASLLQKPGDQITVKAAASKSGNLKILDNGQQIAAGTGKNLETTITVNGVGLHQVAFVASAGTEQDTASFIYIVPEPVQTVDPPAGSQLGINYTSATSARLLLYAPNKQVVYAIGDFSNWLPNPSYQMRRSVDGKTWWVDLGNLKPGQITRFQYLVDGTLRIADPLSDLILDPFNDAAIPAVTYPDLPAYPSGLTSGTVSVLQTERPVFNWQASNYQRPKKTDLVVYELLLRDFVARHDYQTLLDSLDYLERLGITAIELMPINEFDNNNSWGYNPAFHKAIDKYYGTAEALKTLVDECHKRNIAVIADVVFNQVTGASPLAQLYWDAANNRPAADNPWLNPTAKHEFNVFLDFNHESQATKAYVKNCLEYWLREYKLDGFRFDLSKGFTQKNTIGSVSAWGQYDPSRIAIWKDYANFIWAIDPATYVILEHFADNTEEKELAGYGMMLWGNMFPSYKEVALGFSSGLTANLTGVSYKDRGWTVPHLIGYMESHDEERIGYECITYGNSAGSYSVKNPTTALRRIEMLNNLLYTIPGPKMLWQFGELGYDFSIGRCEDGTIKPNDCRTSPKPIRWDYYQSALRRRLYTATAALLHLRKNMGVFETSNYNTSALASGPIRSLYLNDNAADEAAIVVSNIGLTAAPATINWTDTGWWYNYYTGDSLLVNTLAPSSLTLQPGEYRLFLNKRVPLPPGIQFTAAPEVSGAFKTLEVYPNPFENRFLLDFSLQHNAEVQVEIHDLAGRLVHSAALGALPEGDQAIEIETGDWAPGYYLLSLRDAKGGKAVRKVVKM